MLTCVVVHSDAEGNDLTGEASGLKVLSGLVEMCVHQGVRASVYTYGGVFMILTTCPLHLRLHACAPNRYSNLGSNKITGSVTDLAALTTVENLYVSKAVTPVTALST